MGGILSRWKKSKTTVEVLEQIDKDISRLEKFKRSNHETKKRIIGSLILYSVILYIIGCASLYVFYTPVTAFDRLLQVTPPLCFPFLIYLLKRFLHWWFIRKIEKNDTQLQILRDQRKDILENVMETETYKRAKEILEKFDPETKMKLEEERNRREAPQASPAPGTELRRRNVPNQVLPNSPKPAGMSGTPMTPGQVRGPTPLSSPLQHNNGTMRGPRPPVILPRPLLNQNRTAMDKVLEYLTGDGPSNRYALICKNCFSHNGMALKEEFEYLEYRCGYCRCFNPARKQRPNAPALPTRISPIHPDEMPKPHDHDSGNDESPISSKESETEHGDGVQTKLPGASHAKKLQFDEPMVTNQEEEENIKPVQNEATQDD